MIRVLIIASALLFAVPALADPCTASVDGYRPGQRIAGLVWYAGDGDSLCVGPSPDPRTWIEVREARWFAPELNEPGGRKAKAVMDASLAGAPSARSNAATTARPAATIG